MLPCWTWMPIMMTLGVIVIGERQGFDRTDIIAVVGLLWIGTLIYRISLI